MLAYADGKEIEYLDENYKWVECKDPEFNWTYTAGSYRIKPEPTYRPFANAEECWQEMQKHQPFGWIRCKEIDSLLCIDYMCKDTVSAEAGCLTTFKILFEQGDTFADGEPFGVKEDAQ